MHGHGTAGHGATGHVWLVGAGPGDPGLITVRGRQLLTAADVIVHDRLVSPELLDLAKPGAELVDASKSPGNHRLSQEQIQEILVARARSGLEVVRLKGGDPFVYGRGWEEVEACARAGLPCTVVPGISSAIGVPTAAGIPLTLRGQAASVGIVTPSVGETLQERGLPYSALSALDTLVVLMGWRKMDELIRGLIEAGKDPDTPAAIVQEGTLPGERSARGTLATIAAVARDHDLQSPMILVLGPGAREGSVAPSGSGRGPLAHRTVVLTRPPLANEPLSGRLRDLGATVVETPLIRIEYRDAPLPPDLDPYSWTVFTSLHGVRGLARLLQAHGKDARFFSGTRVAAVGPKTAAELHLLGIRPDLVPSEHRAKALVQAIGEKGRAGDRVFFPCGTLALDELPDGLGALGFPVERCLVYDTLPGSMTPEALAALHAGVDAVLLYSPSAAKALAQSGAHLGAALVACVGRTTADAAHAAGLPVHAVPERYGDPGMIGWLLEQFAPRS